MTSKPHSPLNAEKILDDEYLAVRSRLLDIAAVLDRLERAPRSVSGDARLEKFRQAFQILAGGAPNKTEQVQLLFSI
ncbi:MAG: hypothetical protein JXB10_03790 [Pirellulales bacterium]|nr:hypothetical protein [Pirellulales bacterium]